MFFSTRTWLGLSVLASAGSALDVKKLVKKHQMVLFSKPGCPYCGTAKVVLYAFNPWDWEQNEAFKVIETSAKKDDAERNALKEVSGVDSVPQLFINGKYWGDSSHIEKTFRDGSLRKYLEEVGMLKTESEDKVRHDKLNKRLEHLADLMSPTRTPVWVWVSITVLVCSILFAALYYVYCRDQTFDYRDQAGQV